MTDPPTGANTRSHPGWVNAHTHIYSGLAPLGMPPPEDPPQSFLQILERVWWRLDRALDADTLRASARYYAAEALYLGTTTLVDHHESPNFVEGSLDVLADSCQELGIRAVLCFGATERNGGREEARRGLEECRRFIRSNDRPLVRGLVGLHASFTVSDDAIRDAAALCRTLGVGLHVHLAEDEADVEDAKRRGYPGPLERLLAMDALPPGSVLAHGVHLDAKQVRRVASKDLWIVQNPRSNRGNRVGYPRHLRESVRVAIGTDGYPADRAAEAAALDEVSRENGDDLTAATRRIDQGRAMIDALFEDDLDADRVDRNDAGEVTRVVVRGREVIREGQLVAADRDDIRREATEAAPRLWARMSAIPAP